MSQKPKLTEAERIESEDQQLLLMNLLNDFENYLEMIREIFQKEQIEQMNDDDQWLDVDEGEHTPKIPNQKCEDITAEAILRDTV